MKPGDIVKLLYVTGIDHAVFGQPAEVVPFKTYPKLHIDLVKALSAQGTPNAKDVVDKEFVAVQWLPQGKLTLPQNGFYTKARFTKI